VPGAQAEASKTKQEVRAELAVLAQERKDQARKNALLAVSLGAERDELMRELDGRLAAESKRLALSNHAMAQRIAAAEQQAADRHRAEVDAAFGRLKKDAQDRNVALGKELVALEAELLNIAGYQQTAEQEIIEMSARAVREMVSSQDAAARQQETKDLEVRECRETSRHTDKHTRPAQRGYKRDVVVINATSEPFPLAGVRPGVYGRARPVRVVVGEASARDGRAWHPGPSSFPHMPACVAVADG
jgi:hypothetical protein